VMMHLLGVLDTARHDMKCEVTRYDTTRYDTTRYDGRGRVVSNWNGMNRMGYDHGVLV
jgi:hypothetical protein